ncbi:hypothetical protein [Streptomyces sp. VNUA24]|uniref:hypothetical protein n=1 Tax=Streptomyces sp. VNUA24 TaxID=3031131 RepID=UPI0023B8841F|nr:hypothetical protein [Streptomyces sp. VNUA24]WEH18067.1 hypothetical protein PYR72_32125 [Streptomyces sp. VNUA24]
MRRTARPLTATALAVAFAALAAAPAYGGPYDGGGSGRLVVSPAGVVPGDEVTVRTTACGPDGTATGDAGAVGAGSFSLASGAGEQRLGGRFEVPPSAQPGTYEIVATCADDGRRVTGDLVVSLTGTRTAPPAYPRGSVKTGVGGALGPDPVQTAAGVAALAVAAAGGTWLLHRRARGDGI